MNITMKPSNKFLFSGIPISRAGKARGCSKNRVVMTQFQIDGGGLVQGVTKLIMTFSTLVTKN